jgi:outer membrane receptor protein involved in Fe transport
VFLGWRTENRFIADSDRDSKQITMFRPLVGNLAPDALGIVSVGQGTSTGGRGYLVLGDADHLQMLIGADGRVDAAQQRETILGGLTPFDSGLDQGLPASRQSGVGGFVSMMARPTSATVLATGFRVDHINAQEQVSNRNADFLVGLGYVEAHQRISQSAKLLVKASYAMRAPTMLELFGERTRSPIARFGNSIVDGNPDLDPERNFQLELGISASSDRWRGMVKAFHSMIGDYILYRVVDVASLGPSTLGRSIGGVPIGDASTVRYQFINVDRVRILGGNAFVEVDLNPSITGFAGVVYARGIDESQSVSDGIPNLAPLTGTLGLRWTDPCRKNTGLELVGRLVHAQTNFARSLGEVGTPGYTVWSVRGWVEIADHCRVMTAVNNAFDADYVRHGALAIADPTTGRLYFVPEPGLSWTTTVELTY